MRIDAHQHFWHYEPAEFGWITDPILARDFAPADLFALLKLAGLDGCIAVQARTIREETDFLLGCADRFDIIKAVTGWVDLLQPDVAARLARWDGRHKLRGIRHVLQAEPDVAAILTNEIFLANIATLQSRRLIYELLITQTQFTGVAAFCAAMDSEFLVLDHLGKPKVGQSDDHGLAVWRADLKALGALPHVACKLSGLVTEADGAVTPDDFTPYLDAALEAFGPDRIMFGSDWPVCTRAASYADVCGLIENWSEKLTDTEQAALWGGNAARIYRIS